jgi:hypothetical protein
MIFTSKYTNLTAPTAGRGKRGFFALGEAAQKKLYTAEYVPSSAGEWGLIFALLPLPHAPVGIPPNFSRMAHSATGCSGHHRTTGSVQTPQTRAARATSASGSLRPHGLQMGNNRMKPYRKVNHGPRGQRCIKEKSHNESP